MDGFLVNDPFMLDLRLRIPETTISDTNNDSQNKFKLIVPSSNRPVFCSKKVIDSSLLLMDMLEFVNDEDPG